MRVMDKLEGYGEVIAVPVESMCGDGRKIPHGIDMERFIQMNLYQWIERLPYDKMIFVYNPFAVFPITNRSIIDTIDPGRKTYESKHRGGNYYLRRTFDSIEGKVDPIYTENAICVFANDIPAGELFFQCNHPELDETEAGLVVITKENLQKYLRTVRNHRVVQGVLARKERF